MDYQIRLEETLVTLSFVQSRCYALRAEVEKLRQELETYKVKETQGITDGNGAD